MDTGSSEAGEARTEGADFSAKAMASQAGKATSEGPLRPACSEGLWRDLEGQPKTLGVGSWLCIVNVASDGPTPS